MQKLNVAPAVVCTVAHAPAPAGQGFVGSHQYRQTPVGGLPPLPRQARPLPQATVLASGLQDAPAWPAPAGTQAHVVPFALQHVCPEGQS